MMGNIILCPQSGVSQLSTAHVPINPENKAIVPAIPNRISPASSKKHRKLSQQAAKYRRNCKYIIV